LPVSLVVGSSPPWFFKRTKVDCYHGAWHKSRGEWQVSRVDQQLTTGHLKFESAQYNKNHPEQSLGESGWDYSDLVNFTYFSLELYMASTAVSKFFMTTPRFVFRVGVSSPPLMERS